MVNVRSSQKRASKKININAGDVLVLPQTNGKYTLAYVLGLWPNLKSVMSIALLRKEIADNLPQGDELARLVSREVTDRVVMAIVSVPVLPAKKSEWPKIGTVTDVDVEDLLPTIPFRSGSTVGGTYVSSPMVEGLVSAYRGLTDWDVLLPGRPGYLKSLLFERTNRVTH